MLALNIEQSCPLLITPSASYPSSSSAPSSGTRTVPDDALQEEDAINLYQLAVGFFVEVYFGQFEMKVYRTQAFNSLDYIHNHYTTYVQLPPLE